MLIFNLFNNLENYDLQLQNILNDENLLSVISNNMKENKQSEENEFGVRQAVNLFFKLGKQ